MSARYSQPDPRRFGRRLTPLDALEPIGVGSAEVESLSSYVQRLSWAHGGMPGQLVHRVLRWLDQRDYESVGKWALRPGRLRIGFNNNSFSLADTWIRLIHQVTGRADLPPMTTRDWDHRFPTRGFEASSLGWCALCLKEDAEPYHRLAWMVQPVRVCLKHGRALQRQCRRCGKMPAVLHDRSHTIRCPWCAGDLRLADESLPLVPRDHFDFWVAAEIGKIVATAGQCHRTISWDPRRAFGRICEAHRLTPGAFARALGTGKLTTWCWLQGKARPSLPSALRVYHRFGLSLAAHLAGEPRSNGLTEPRQIEFHLRSRRPARAIDWDAIRRELLAVLRKSISDAPTLLAVSQRLTIARRTLRVHESALCLQIAQRRRLRVRLEADQRAELLSGELRTALIEFRSRGKDPTWRELAAAIGRPKLFNSAYARRILSHAR